MNKHQLTREQIMSMEPGRELDALVSEIVMEVRVTHGGPLADGGNYISDKIMENHYQVKKFRPSTYLPHTWEVVEKIEPEYWVRMHVMQGDHYCGIGRPDLLWECKAKSMPEATCKAALLSLIQEDTPKH